jgi:hypothetical protein
MNHPELKNLRNLLISFQNQLKPKSPVISQNPSNQQIIEVKTAKKINVERRSS